MAQLKAALSLAVWIVISLTAGMIGSRFMPGAWYESIAKPSWTPPDLVFGPVWTLLYILMGVAAWIVWRSGAETGRLAPLSVFIFQLALNALWSYIFFGLHKPGAAFAEILALWAMILATLVLFWRVRPAAGFLLIPYLAWVTFASALNYQIWRLNI